MIQNRWRGSTGFLVAREFVPQPNRISICSAVWIDGSRERVRVEAKRKIGGGATENQRPENDGPSHKELGRLQNDRLENAGQTLTEYKGSVP